MSQEKYSISAAMISNTDRATVYIRLLDEGTLVFRPTQGISLGNSRFKLLPTEDYDPEDEIWEFQPGSVVECEFRELGGEKVLVAASRVRSEAIDQS